jgi:predicted glutamine amidotransferase
VLELGERNLLQHVRHSSPAQTKRSSTPFFHCEKRGQSNLLQL